MTTPAPAWQPPVLLRETNSLTGVAGNPGLWTLPGPVPAGPLLITAGTGSLQVVVESVTDSKGNDWRMYAASVAQRPTWVAYCQAARALDGGDVISFNPAAGSGLVGGARCHLIALSQRAEVGPAYFYGAANNNAPAVAVPDAQAGELLIAAMVVAGNLTLANNTWDFLGPTTNTPTFRTVWRIAAGPESFTGTLSGANSWAFSGVRLTPARPDPLKVWDGAGWRAVSRAA